MARRRGFFAELQHQHAVAQRKQQQQQRAAQRQQAAVQREAERARAAALRARETALRADARAAAEAEKEAKRLHIAAQEAEVESLNAALKARLDDIDGLLAWTLDFDDYVDLEVLRKQVEHPPFSSPHETPIPAPVPIPQPPQPVLTHPEPPKGLSGLFGKKKHEQAIAEAEAKHAQLMQAWETVCAAIPVRQLEDLKAHREAEENRLQSLAAHREEYDRACAERENEINNQNAELDRLIADLEANKPDAIEEYIGIVFSNAVYPDGFPWPPSCKYDSMTRELTIEVEYPSPDSIPAEREYKYVKAKDEIVATNQTAKERRDRYASLVHQMTLRVIHEAFESDRAGRIATISFKGGVNHVDPATGKETTTYLVALGVGRDDFLELDLSRVAPAETLKHLKATVSKNPYALAGISAAPSIRGY